MLKSIGATRKSGRQAGRWFGVIAIAAVVAFGVAACTGDTAALTNKSVGGEARPIVDGDLISAKEEGGGDGSGQIPDELEDDVREAQEAQAETKPAVITDNSDQVVPEITLEDNERVKGLKANAKLLPGDPRIAMDISTVAPLKRTAWSQTQSFKGCNDLDRPPFTLAAGGEQHWCMSAVLPSVDAEVDVRYQIGKTNEVLHITSKVPFTGDNVLSCEILNATTGKPVQASRYTCEKSWQNAGDKEGYGHGNNPKPRIALKMKSKIEVTDAAEARQLLLENCGDGQPNCTYNTAHSWAALDDWSEREILSGPAFNCNNPHEPDHHEWSKGQAFDWTNKIGGEAGVKWEVIPEVLKVEASVHYEHEWTESYDFKQKLEAPVAYGTVHYFFTQQGKIYIQGDFEVSKADAIYVVKNTTFELPLAKKYKIPQGGGRVIEPVSWTSASYPITCKNGRPVELPDPFVDEPNSIEKHS